MDFVIKACAITLYLSLVRIHVIAVEPRSAFARKKSNAGDMKSIVLGIIAAICIAAGIATVLLPLPVGVPLIALGVMILITTNRRFAALIGLLRRRYQRLDRGLRWIEDRAGPKLAGPLFKTRPKPHPPATKKSTDDAPARTS